ncbi:heterokaryon incompatibility protein-domain-containing protein [Truncatella angustata]|uniref:Heterokaryon incompatibility protein-domain-containing protein n=1 Tax=Truncatella angustata TaxID=152316 RepID=A0A9P8UII0_9PEZI|nr:heterokaryon incompatibility protein-domain-containing protein [Truncatella angustata]KAH6652724.1 heterokaryon incompatibility protein-domain-containing protein [Truncatella angustata]
MAVVPLPANQPYVTLSYVWGSPANETLGRSGLPESLPRTIGDSVIVAKQLGIRYLWVDRYCIPQNDEEVKHSQIQRMADLYSGSTVTIIAAAGEDAEYSLPGATRERTPQTSISVRRSRLVVPKQTCKEISKSKWNSRGWTLQEELLATRRLVFTDSHVYFQCRKGHVYEDTLSPATVDDQLLSLGEPVFLHQERNTSHSDMWQILAEYMMRDLTYDTDTINAVTGVLNAHDSETIAGLPMVKSCHWGDGTRLTNTEVLAVSLVWSVDSPYMSTESNPATVRRKIFPSWTWVGWKIVRKEIDPFLLSEQGIVVLHIGEARYALKDMLSFESDWQQIISLSSFGKYPECLILSGWTFSLNSFDMATIDDSRRIEHIKKLRSGQEIRPGLLGLVLLQRFLPLAHGLHSFFHVLMLKNQGDMFERSDTEPWSLEVQAERSGRKFTAFQSEISLEFVGANDMIVSGSIQTRGHEIWLSYGQIADNEFEKYCL